MSIRFARPVVAALLVAHLVACGDDAAPPDAAVDAAPGDAAVDDAATDASADAATDASASADALLDAPVDATPDAPDDATPDAPDDATPDAPVDATPDAPVDAAPDAPVDASPTAPIIADVVRADGGRQVRQQSSVELVVTGERLAGATAVTLGPLAGSIVAASDTELRVAIEIPSGIAPSSLALTVTAPGGATTHPDAIVTTYFVFAPGASGGRGTYEAPHGLCDPEVYGQEEDRYELLPGRYVGTCMVETLGASVAGAGTDTTVIAGPLLILNTDPGATSTVENLTFEGSLVYAEGDRTARATFRDVRFEGSTVRADNTGIGAERVRARASGLMADSAVVIDSYFEGPGTPLVVGGAAVSGSTFTGCDTAIEVGAGSLDLRDSTIDGCGAGVRTAAVPWWHQPGIAIIDCVFLDIAAGAYVSSGQVLVEGTMFLDRRPPPAGPSFAVIMQHGWLTVRDSVVEGPGEGVGTSSNCEMVTTVELAGNVIEVAGTGVRHDGCDAGSMYMRRNRVTGGNAAVDIDVIDSFTSVHDLGQPGDPGGNELVVTSPTGYALIDRRNADTINHVTMSGSTLNGRSYAGQTVQGPADVPPDYRITDDDTIDF